MKSPVDTIMVRRIPNEDGSGFTKNRQMLVIYENSAARKYTLNQCPQLAEFDPTEPEASIHWFSFDAVGNSSVAELAGKKASIAELVVFAFSPGGDLPGEVKAWIESWIGKRAEIEGAIVGLVTKPSLAGDVAGLKEIYLRHTALRASMDYLCSVPPVLPEPMPDTPDSYTRRAGQVSSVLDEILRANWPPPTLPG